MKTLIVHPQDPTTSFLQGLYIDLPNKTVITGGITKSELRKHITAADRVLCLGHGSSQGLLSVGQFPGSGLYIIDDTMVSTLTNKTRRSFFVWCQSVAFVRRHGLTGFHTGMFLSQMSECWYFGVHCTEENITESNRFFAETVAHHINEPPIVFYRNVLSEYSRLMKNPVARYNHSRLFLNHYEPHFFVPKVHQTL